MKLKKLWRKHQTNPGQREAQKALARGVTEVVHGKEATEAVINLSERLFKGGLEELTSDEICEFSEFLATAKKRTGLFEVLVKTGLCTSKGEARKLAAAGAITVNGVKVTEDTSIEQVAIVKRGRISLRW